MPRIPILPKDDSAPPKAFALNDPFHMFMKLEWEFTNLRDAIKNDSDSIYFTHTPSYHAFNFAVTAWHMIDWVWADANDASRQCLKDYFGAADMTRPAHLRDAIASRFRCIHICGQIANGSKHRDLWPSTDDPSVGVSVEWEGIPAAASELRAGEPLVRFKRHLVVKDGTKAIPALEVFRDAIRTWDQLMGEWGFREDRFIDANTAPLPWERD